MADRDCRREPAPGEATESRVRSVFSSIAGTYDLLNALISFGVDRRWRKRAVRFAGIGRGDVVLDLATGTGDLALAAARLASPASIELTDFVPEMLEVAKGKVAKYEGPTDIRISIADAQDLPFDDGSFDVATIGFGIRNVPDRAANFREVLRVLRPGGRYAVLEFSRLRSAPFRALYHWYLGHVIPFLGGLLAHDRESYQYLNDSVRAFPRQEELAAELKAAGFSSVEWRDMTGGIAAVHLAIK